METELKLNASRMADPMAVLNDTWVRELLLPDSGQTIEMESRYFDTDDGLYDIDDDGNIVGILRIHDLIKTLKANYKEELQGDILPSDNIELPPSQLSLFHTFSNCRYPSLSSLAKYTPRSSISGSATPSVLFPHR